MAETLKASDDDNDSKVSCNADPNSSTAENVNSALSSTNRPQNRIKLYLNVYWKLMTISDYIYTAHKSLLKLVSC